MEILWAPWRMQFIEDLRKEKGGCIFCEMTTPGDDRERLVLFRGKVSYVLMNRYPYNNGHLLIVPYRHLPSLKDLDAEEYQEIMELTSRSVDIMTDAMNAEGFNCGINLGRAAGAGITEHVHMHVVPRWVGDSNFLPILSGTRSMPEYLTQTYDRLAPGFQKISKGA
jgi:ATP adenylyltransferase